MILNKLLRKHLGRGVVSTSRLNKYFVGFLFSQVNASKFTRVIKREFPEATNDQVKAFRMSISNNGYILLHLKPYLFRAYKAGFKRRGECAWLGRKFGVKPSDLKLILCCYETSRMVQHMDALASTYKALSPETLKRRIMFISSGQKVFVTKFVMRKMRFIWQNPHNSTTAKDMTTDCIIQGMQSVLVKFPRIESFKHAENIFKRGAHNGGINMIKTFTRQSRAAIVRDGDSFVSQVGFFDENVDSGNVLDHKQSDMQKLEGRINIQQLLRFYKGPKKVALKALMGLYLADFTDWLHDNAQPRHRKANDQLFEDCLERKALGQYEDYLIEYLGIDQPRFGWLKRDVQRYL